MKVLRALAAVGTLALAFTSAHAQFEVDVERIVGGLSNPVAVRNAGDGSNRLFVVEQTGTIRIVANGELEAAPFLNVAVNCCGEQGLLGLAFHPQYAENGFFFVNYSEPGSGRTVIARYQVSNANPNLADTNSRVELMNIRQDFGNHNGGDLHFGSDGYLYIGMGDGGSGGDPCNRSQRVDPDQVVAIDPDNFKETPCSTGDEDPTSALLGKMLRVDVDAATPAGSNNLCAASGNGSAPYAIPTGNPYRGDANACGEIWALGLRNPFRFSFDRDTGDLFVGDVGQDDFEEISFLAEGTGDGANFGWDCREGNQNYENGIGPGNSSAQCIGSGPLTAPIAEYSHAGDNLCSITGGYSYRGPVRELQGAYVHSDYCRSEFFFLVERGSQWSRAGSDEAQETSGAAISRITGFGEGEDGSLYVVSLNQGRLYQFVGARLFADGFEQR